MPGALAPQPADQRYHARHSRRQAPEHHAYGKQNGDDGLRSRAERLSVPAEENTRRYGDDR